MTIHVGADRADAAQNAFGAAARRCKLIELKPIGIGQSDEFIKTMARADRNPTFAERGISKDPIGGLPEASGPRPILGLQSDDTEVSQ